MSGTLNDATANGSGTARAARMGNIVRKQGRIPIPYNMSISAGHARVEHAF